MDLAQELGISDDELAAIISQDDPEYAQIAKLLVDPYYGFVPRPDNPAEFDQQASYVNASDLVSFLIGGNGCLAPETEVYDPIARRNVVVGEQSEPFHVNSWNPQLRRVEVGIANVPFVKGTGDLYRIRLSNGESFIATSEHRVLDCHGTWVLVEQLEVGSSLLRPLVSDAVQHGWKLDDGVAQRPLHDTNDQVARQSGVLSGCTARTIQPSRQAKVAARSLASNASGVACHEAAQHASRRQQQFDVYHLLSRQGSFQSACRQDVVRSSRTRTGYRDRYFLDRRPCDAQLQLVSTDALEAIRRSGDASERTHLNLPSDEVAQALGRTHPYLSSDRLSRLDSSIPMAGRLDAFGSHAYCTPSRRASDFYQAVCRSQSRTNRQLRTIDAFSQPASRSCSSVPFGTIGGNEVNSSHVTSKEFLRQGEFLDFTVWPHGNYILAGAAHHNSGKTLASAQKCARFVLEKQPPPRADTPFWIVSDSYDQVCGIAWDEKLSKIIPPDCIDWERIHWYRHSQNWPFAVPLKPWKGRPGKNWSLQFKSYQQGREQFQGRSIGGAWFSEQFTWDIFTEVLRGCRDYMYPGSIFAEFTPIDPALVVDVKKKYDDPPPGWGFYRTNTKKNVEAGHVSDEWFDSFMSTVSEEMRDTRVIGAFAGYEGVIYQQFNPAIHLVNETPIPPCVYHRRSLDWGASVEHPFVVLWGYRDAMGRYVIYDEYHTNSQGMTLLDHIKTIKNRHPWPENNSYYYHPIYADPSALDSHKVFHQMGLPTHPAINDVDRGVEIVRRLLKVNPAIGEKGSPMLIINKKTCPKLAEQMGTYRWKQSSGRGLNPEKARPVPLKQNDDAVDALRYFIATDFQQTGSAPVPVSRIWQPRPGILLGKTCKR